MITDKIKKPKMIYFDFGGTLILEDKMDGVRGTYALMPYVTENPDNITPEQIQALADKLNEELLRTNSHTYDRQITESHNHSFMKYLYEFFNIRFSIDWDSLEKIFWDNAHNSSAAENIEPLLSFLHENGIRTGIISNISYSGDTLKYKADKLLPYNHFSEIIASSEYMFRKPHKMIFEIAIKKANLSADDIWFCGDNSLCDVFGSHNAGMYPVFYKRAEGISEPDGSFPYLTITNWLELIDVLLNI